MGQGSGYNPGYYGGGFGYPQRMSQPFMGGKGGGMGGMGGMGGYPQMYQTQMPQWAMSQPQFSPFASQGSMYGNMSPQSYAGNMMGSFTPSWASTRNANNSKMITPNYSYQPTQGANQWSDAAEYYRERQRMAEQMQGLQEFQSAGQRANVSHLNPFGPAAKKAADYYSGTDVRKGQLYGRSGMGDALDTMRSAGRAYSRGNLRDLDGKLIEGTRAEPESRHSWELDEDSGTLRRFTKSPEQIQREQQQKTLDVARLLSSIPQLGSKPGLSSLAGGS